MKFGHVEMDIYDTPIVWDALSKDEFDFIIRAKNVYEQCLRYSGRDVHEVNSAAGNILDSAYHFLFSFTENALKPNYMDNLNETCKDSGGWREHSRKMTEEGIERAVKALNDLSCYEKIEIQSALTGISKADILKEIGHRINDYYFFVSTDGIFNWFDLNGNHVEDPEILKEIKEDYISTNITKCIVPNGVTSIGVRAFSYCWSLTSITIPNSVISIDEDAFFKCTSLKEIIIPDSVTHIGTRAFFNCKSLKEIIIPDSVTNINGYAFQDCYSLTSITIPNTVTGIGNCAFSCCTSLKEITIPNSVISIRNDTFQYCKSLKEIIIPNSVISIGNYAFYRCESLMSITIPNSVIRIGFNAFQDCDSLTSITIPDSVISIGEDAFRYCYSLKHVIFKGKTLDEVKQMKNYPFGIEDENVFKFN